MDTSILMYKKLFKVAFSFFLTMPGSPKNLKLCTLQNVHHHQDKLSSVCFIELMSNVHLDF